LGIPHGWLGQGFIQTSMRIITHKGVYLYWLIFTPKTRLNNKALEAKVQSIYRRGIVTVESIKENSALTAYFLP